MRKKHKKGVKRVIVLMAISLSVLMLVNNMFEIICSTMDSLTNSILARRIDICFSWDEYEEIGGEVIDKINSLKNKHVMGVYSGGYTSGYIDGSEECGVTYVPEKVLEEYMNNPKELTLKDDEVILPKYVNTPNGYMKRSEEDYIGKTIEYTIYKEKNTSESENQTSIGIENTDKKIYNLKIKGLYDNAKSGMENSGMIVSNKTIMEMIELTRQDIDEDSDVLVVSSSMYVYVYVTIDNYKNAEVVRENIEAVLDTYEGYGLTAGTYVIGTSDEFYSLQVIQLFANLIASFLLVCAVLSLFSYIKDMMSQRKQEFGIMKAIGYRTSGICQMLIKELIFEITIPLGTALLLGIASVIIADSFFSSNLSIYEYAKLDIKLYGSILTLIIGIAIVLPFIGYSLMVVKISRLEPMEALK